MSAQWASLRSSFLRRDSCLLFHLKNHYALVFALREWVEDEAEDGVEAERRAEDALAAAAFLAPPLPAPHGDDSCSPEDGEGKERKEGKPGGEPVGDSSSRNDCAPPKLTAPPPRRGRAVRQLLTSRRGQRPSAWVDFDEARSTMLGWEGYKIMLVSRRS